METRAKPVAYLIVARQRERHGLLREHRGDLQVTAEGLDVPAQGREVDVALALDSRDVRLKNGGPYDQTGKAAGIDDL